MQFHAITAVPRESFLAASHAVSNSRMKALGIFPVPLRKQGVCGRRVAGVAVTAADKDFDSVLNDVAERFEKADNKPAVVAWTAAAVGALVVAEWLINLPLFNVLLGFPIQFLGLITAGNLGYEYYVEKKGDPLSDAEALVSKVTKQLPGLGK